MSDDSVRFTYIVATIFLLAIVAEYIFLSSQMNDYEEYVNERFSDLELFIMDQAELIDSQSAEIESLNGRIQQLEGIIEEQIVVNETSFIPFDYVVSSSLLSESFDALPVNVTPASWVKAKGTPFDYGNVTDAVSCSGNHSLYIHEESESVNATRIELRTCNFTATGLFEVHYMVFSEGGRGVLQVNRGSDGQHVFMLSCMDGSCWQYWVDYGYWTLFEDVPATLGEWHDIHVIVDTGETRFKLFIDGNETDWIDADYTWENIQYITFRGNYNYPGDYWIDDFSINIIEPI